MSPGIVTLTEEQAHALVHDDLDGAGPCLMNEALSPPPAWCRTPAS